MEFWPQNNSKDSELLGLATRIRKRTMATASPATHPHDFLNTKGVTQPFVKNAGQKYTVLIIDSHRENSLYLENCIDTSFSEIAILAVVDNFMDARKVLLRHEVDLIFSDSNDIDKVKDFLTGKSLPDFVLLSEHLEDAKCALRNNMSGFISIPLDQDDVAISIKSALRKIDRRRMQPRIPIFENLPHKKLVGVPTIEGIEFLDTDTIIRCEGLQKCTRIVTTEKSDVISSYNLGKFKDLLGGRGFFSCHRSHHINLKFVKKYTREGYIYFTANSKPVPLARRRKCDFLDQIRHL